MIKNSIASKNLRLPVELKSELELIAKSNQRSLNSEIVHILKIYVDKRNNKTN